MTTTRDISREQRKSATVRQCLNQRGEWVCLRPANHEGRCFQWKELGGYALADARREGVLP